MLSNDNSKQNYSTGGVPGSPSAIPVQPMARAGVGPVTVSRPQPASSPITGVASTVSKTNLGNQGQVSAPTAKVATATPGAGSGQKQPLPVSATPAQSSTVPSANSESEYPLPQQSFLGNDLDSGECLDKTPEQVELETLKVAKRLHIRKIIFGILSIVGLIACFLICLGCGREDIWPFTAVEVVWNHITGMGEFSLADKIVIWDIRLPIVIAATLAGAALSVSGTSNASAF